MSLRRGLNPREKRMHLKKLIPQLRITHPDGTADEHNENW